MKIKGIVEIDTKKVNPKKLKKHLDALLKQLRKDLLEKYKELH